MDTIFIENAKFIITKLTNKRNMKTKEVLNF